MTQTSASNNSERSDLLSKVTVINIGLEKFYTSLLDQEADVIHVSWSPPAGGDEDLINILDKLL